MVKVDVTLSKFEVDVGLTVPLEFLSEFEGKFCSSWAICEMTLLFLVDFGAFGGDL